MTFLILWLISFSASAQEKAELERAFKILENPGHAIHETCSEQTPSQESDWCKNLGVSVCATPIRKNTLAAVSAQLNKKFFKPLLQLRDPVTKKIRFATLAEENSAKINAITEAQKLVATNTGVSEADMQTLFSQAMTSIKETMKTMPFDAQTKDLMTTALNETKLQTSLQFITEYAAEIKASSSYATEWGSNMAALAVYERVCGSDGMTENAFRFVKGQIVICPGLIQSYADYGLSKDKILRALSKTMGHEIAHNIDANLFPTAYSAYAKCQAGNTAVTGQSWEDIRGEITADVWGVDVYAKKLAGEGITGQDAFDELSTAYGNFCKVNGDETHPGGMHRLEEYFGRDPQMRKNLGCTTPPIKTACKF